MFFYSLNLVEKIVCVMFVCLLWNSADTNKVDLVMNLVERPSRGFSAGGGISSG